MDFTTSKTKKRESDIDCIKKKIKEELPEVESEIVRFYKVFSKTSSCGGLENRVYLTEIRGNINKTSNKIEEARWFYYIQTLTYELSDITKKIIEDMKRKGYL